jgi:hypothetical protein
MAFLRDVRGGPAMAALILVLGLLNGCATPPGQPTAREHAALLQHYPLLRPTLDSLLGEVRRATAGGAAPQRVDSAMTAPQALITTFEPVFPQTFRTYLPNVIMLSDSLIYFPTIARRGTGPSAGWAISGYAYATRDPSTHLMGAKPASPGSVPYQGTYTHLSNDWYAFSMTWEQ